VEQAKNVARMIDKPTSSHQSERNRVSFFCPTISATLGKTGSSCSDTLQDLITSNERNTERGLPRVGDKDDLQFNLERVVDSLARIVETRTRRVSV